MNRKGVAFTAAASSRFEIAIVDLQIILRPLLRNFDHANVSMNMPPKPSGALTLDGHTKTCRAYGAILTFR